MRYLLSHLISLAALWLLLSGHFDMLLLTLGGASIALVAFLSYRMRIIDAETQPLHLAGRLQLYWLWLAGEILKSSADVVRRIARPGAPAISPTLVEVSAQEKTELGQVIFANSITLTPGTVSTGLTEGRIQVHALTRENADELAGGEMDRRVRAMEGRP